MGQLCTLSKRYRTWEEIYFNVCNYKNEWEPSLPSSKKQVILKQKIKNHFHEISFAVWFDTHPYRELSLFLKEI